MTDKKASPEINKKHLVLFHITTVASTFLFFRGQIGYMKERGFEVHAVSSPGKRLAEISRQENIPVTG